MDVGRNDVVDVGHVELEPQRRAVLAELESGHTPGLGVARWTSLAPDSVATKLSPARADGASASNTSASMTTSTIILRILRILPALIRPALCPDAVQGPLRHLTLKAYTKGEHVLRFEAIVHNTRDLGCGRVLARAL